MRALLRFALTSLCVLEASIAQAQPSVLVAASDPAQIGEVEVAKVSALDSALWLSVRLSGHTKIAVVTSAASVEPAKAADAWLRALDFSTRVRVSPPPGPLAACTQATGNLADSGAPELSPLAPSQVSSAASELELRQDLALAGLAVDLSRIAAFGASVAAPYRVALYEATDTGGSTAAVRLRDSEPALSVPGIAVAGRDLVPFTLVMLAPTALLPATGVISDPSEFAVAYSGASATTDYVKARGAWLAEDPTRWLLEARASSALFAWTLIPGVGEIEPALAHYYQAAEPRDARSCFAAVESARAHASHDPAEYGCSIADDLQSSAVELDFGDIRLTRLFGSVGAAGVLLRTSDEAERNSTVVATDFDATDCPSPVTVAPGSGGSTVPGGTRSTPTPGGDVNGPYVDQSVDESMTVSSGDSCSVTVFSDSCSGDSSSSSSGSGDSCSGDSSSDPSSSDSCSGNSSSDSGSSDSCSGNSSSDSGSSDSCSSHGSSSDGSDDSSGCGKSNYDGDTCSGSSANSANADTKTTAALEPGQRTQSSRRPRRVHLSLLTLLSALVALPLRRKKLWRLLSTP